LLLLQSQSGEVRLLPALPKEWKNGEIKGLSARGGFVVDMEWKSGNLVTARIKSKKGGACIVNYKGKLKELVLKAEEERVLNF